MPTVNATVAVSAPGKVLLAGGYLVLDRRHTGLVFGLSARINVIAGEIRTEAGVQLNEIVVCSPQFQQAEWRYGYRLAPEDGGIKVTQLQVGPTISANPFVETTLSYALTYIHGVTSASAGKQGSIKPSRLIILADNDYYSQPNDNGNDNGNGDGGSGRFARFPVTLAGANKTGLGSSAALVTALMASLLSHYLPADLFALDSPPGRQTLHKLAQAAHCAAQGKVGSGFDVAAAVFGSCLYRRFSPEILSRLPEPGQRGFGAALAAVVKAEWDAEVDRDAVGLQAGVVLRMCDVTCGSQTVGMVKKVLAWRGRDADKAGRLWDELQMRNEEVAAALMAGHLEELPGRLGRVRELMREMSRLSEVPIEPDSQTALLDGLSAVEGVLGGVVPGAGGYDAVVVVMREGEETKRRVDDFLADWSRQKRGQVKLLGVQGEMEGVRREELVEYAGWV